MPKAAFSMQNVRIITSNIQKVIKIIANLKSNVNNDMIKSGGFGKAVQIDNTTLKHLCESHQSLFSIK